MALDPIAPALPPRADLVSEERRRRALRLVLARVRRPAPTAAPLGPVITRALELIVGRCTERLTVAALAREVGLSEGRFAHLFREEIGVSPLRLVRRVRVELARELLRDDRRRRAEVARVLGFFDGSHLARVFRTETGQSVAAWTREPASA